MSEINLTDFFEQLRYPICTPQCYKVEVGYTHKTMSNHPLLENSLAVAAKEVDVYHSRENFGTNKGTRVNLYLQRVGLSPGYAWCAAFVTFCLNDGGIKLKYLPTKSNLPSACSWLEWGRRNKIVSADPAQVQRGDLFAFCNEGKWQGHIGFVLEAKKVLGVWWIRTIEGNSNEGGSREGTMVARRGQSGILGITGWRRVKPNIRFIHLNQIKAIDSWGV